MRASSDNPQRAMPYTKLLAAVAGVFLGLVASQWFFQSGRRSPEAPKTSDAVAPSVLPQPEDDSDTIRSFRQLLFAQRTRPTLAASRALFDHVKNTRSPAALESMHRELTLMPRLYDPVILLLARVIDVHLQHHAPTSQGILQGEMASRQGFSDRRDALRDWARRDPAAAFRFARNEPIINHRPMMMAAALSGAAQTQPEAAYELWSSVTDADLRHRLANSIAWSLAKAMPERHAEWAAAFPTERPTVYEGSFREWASRAPAEAIAAFDSLEGRAEDLGAAIRGILAGWGKSDPAAAAAWGKQHHARLREDLLRQWAGEDPAAALTYALEIPGHKELEQVATAWLQQDAETTLEWTEENLSTAERGAVYRQALRNASIRKALAEPQVREMAAWLAADPHPQAEDAVGAYLHSFENLGAAREWIETLPVVSQRRLMPLIVEKWVETEPEEAARYLTDLPTARAQAALLRDVIRSPGTSERRQALIDWAKRHLDDEAFSHLNIE